MHIFKVYDYLISCPSDIKDEVEIIKEVVNKYNSSIGEEFGYFIRTKHWSYDTYPELGDHPQSIINKQMVDECDGVIAVFWTRFGSPTQRYESGTEEEIERLLIQQRPVLLYFSNRSINPSIFRNGIEQYKHVEDFREKYSNKGIYSTYDSLDEFKSIFERHFQQHCKRYNINIYRLKNNCKNLSADNKYEHLANRLIDLMNRKSYILIKSIFEDSISKEVSIYFKKLLSEIPNYRRVEMQIFLENVYLLSADNEMARQQCCFYMGCVDTKRTTQFLIELINKEKSYLVLRGIYLALMNLIPDDIYAKSYLEIVKKNPIAASINAGYHQIHYGDKYHCEGYEFDLYQTSANTISALISHINSIEYKKIKALDLFTLRYILYYTYFIETELTDIIGESCESDLQQDEVDEFYKFLKSIKTMNSKTFFISRGLIKRLPTPDWMLKKTQEYKSLIYIDNDFQPVSEKNGIEIYKQQFVLDEEKFDNIISILCEYEEFRVNELNVCDIGCSYGAFLHCWTKHYKGKAMGIDISESAKKVSQLLFKNCYEVVESNAFATLPILLDEADVVTCFDFLEHVFNLEHFLFELYETIKPNTLAVFYIPIFEEICMNLEVLSTSKFFTDSHIYYFTIEGFKRFVSSISTFELLHERSVGQKYLFIYRKK